MKSVKVYFGSLLFACALIFSAIQYYKVKAIEARNQEIQDDLTLLKSEIVNEIIQNDVWAHEVNLKDKRFYINYTINNELQSYVERLLKRRPSDYSAIVVIDNNTGHILAAHGQEKKNRKPNYELLFQNTHPSASLFKIITAAALIEKTDVGPKTRFDFNGKASTLYKYQLKNKKSRWTRNASLKQAFASSNNVVFGKAAINNLNRDSVFEVAREFGFDKNIMSDLDLSKSVLDETKSSYDLAELASGFNKGTQISPIHGALFSYVIANGGEIVSPSLINEVYDVENSEKLHFAQSGSEKVINPGTAFHLRNLMMHTVSKGTARGSFRRLSRKLKSDLMIGGKTGSITGGNPFGKRDWFSSFAIPVDPSKGKGISICVMNINVKKWYVKSAYLARKVIEFYYKNQVVLADTPRSSGGR